MKDRHHDSTSLMLSIEASNRARDCSENLTNQEVTNNLRRSSHDTQQTYQHPSIDWRSMFLTMCAENVN